MFERILVPIDDGAWSERAISMLPLVAGDDARIELLHVLETPTLQRGEDPESHLPVRRRARALLQRHVEQLERLGRWSVETELLSGELFAGLEARLREFAPDLVLMGSQGRRGLSRLIFGSVTERFVRVCPCPILVVKSDVPRPEAFARVVLATDFSPCAIAAREAFARVLQDAAVEERRGAVLHVIEEDERRDDARGELEEELRVLRERGLDCESHLVQGTPSEEIEKLSEAIDAELVVLGVQGRAEHERGWLGSTMDRTLRRVAPSVLVVPLGGAGD